MARITPLAALVLTAAIPAQFDAERAVQAGCDILLEMQEGEDDRWPYEGVYRVQGSIPVGYHVGGTAICARAMIEAPGYRDHEVRQAAVGRALDFVLNLLDDPLMASGFKGRYDVRGWGHTYALLFFLRLAELDAVPDGREEIVHEKTEWLVTTLLETEIPETGGWNYSRPRGFRSQAAASPFMTAPTLQALFWAETRGFEVDASVVERALDSLERGRTKSGGYTYSSGPDRTETDEDDLHFMDKQLGAVGRMVVVEATLELAGRGDADRLAAAVEAFFTHWQHLRDRKQENGTHVGPGGVAPYYFMYAHRYAAQAIELIADEAEREKQRARLWETLGGEVEGNGGWNDRVFPRSRNYGTAFGMLALLEPELPRIRRIEPEPEPEPGKR